MDDAGLEPLEYLRTAHFSREATNLTFPNAEALLAKSSNALIVPLMALVLLLAAANYAVAQPQSVGTPPAQNRRDSGQAVDVKQTRAEAEKTKTEAENAEKARIAAEKAASDAEIVLKQINAAKPTTNPWVPFWGSVLAAILAGVAGWIVADKNNRAALTRLKDELNVRERDLKDTADRSKAELIATGLRLQHDTRNNLLQIILDNSTTRNELRSLLNAAFGTHSGNKAQIEALYKSYKESVIWLFILSRPKVGNSFIRNLKKAYSESQASGKEDKDLKADKDTLVKQAWELLCAPDDLKQAYDLFKTKEEENG